MDDLKFQDIAIVGSGSFGTAMARLLQPKCATIRMIGREQAVADSINLRHRNSHYLTEIELAPHVVAGTRMDVALDADLVIFAVPTSVTREAAKALAVAGLPAHVPLLSCAKGVELETGERMSEILQEVFPENPIAVLSGPNHAEEIARGMATCAVIGSVDSELARRLQDLFMFPHFRSYTSDDVAGLEFGGAIKNIYAIAAGMAHGLGLGDNAVAALVTRALAEMTRLGTALGANPETFAGLSGVGDLVVTCFSEHSRNHRVGLAIGRGGTLEAAVASLGMVAEGVPNTRSIYQLARRNEVRTPIIDAVFRILYEDQPAAEAMRDLLTRDPRPEQS
ncbi:MAG: NAD(P)H-dependent glycerol-3-phosphate dehydrogenase [Luteolibacter sp.]